MFAQRIRKAGRHMIGSEDAPYVHAGVHGVIQMGHENVSRQVKSQN